MGSPCDSDRCFIEREVFAAFEYRRWRVKFLAYLLQLVFLAAITLTLARWTFDAGFPLTAAAPLIVCIGIWVVLTLRLLALWGNRARSVPRIKGLTTKHVVKIFPCEDDISTYHCHVQTHETVFQQKGHKLVSRRTCAGETEEHSNLPVITLRLPDTGWKTILHAAIWGEIDVGPAGRIEIPGFAWTVTTVNDTYITVVDEQYPFTSRSVQGTIILPLHESFPLLFKSIQKRQRLWSILVANPPRISHPQQEDMSETA